MMTFCGAIDGFLAVALMKWTCLDFSVERKRGHLRLRVGQFYAHRLLIDGERLPCQRKLVSSAVVAV